jgi:hydrogenase nickel incorporation protein HypB
MPPQPRIVQVRQQILKKNDEQARALRKRFAEAKLLVVSMVSSPGAGKTTLLRRTLIELSKEFRVAALVGDLATENDAKRLAESGAPVRQIVTGTVCHLEADMVELALDDWDIHNLDILFIENVGNLVCPASYDLGENLRVVLFSTTEGEDKPRKYPTIFNSADVTIVTKSDLAEILEFKRDEAYDSVEDVRPGMKIIELSSRSGAGMDQWLSLLRQNLLAVRGAAC